MRVIFLGPPGSGKGTQAARLAAAAGVPQIATGDILRQAAARGTRLGLEAKAHMDRGALVPDDVVVGVVAERLDAPDARKGFVLDGFPRTLAQAEALERLLKDRDAAVERVIALEVSEAELLRRLTGRRVCGRCQAAYHVAFSPPRREGTCDRCGGALAQREDDREATVRRRIEVYRAQTAPLLEHYRSRGLLVTVTGEGSVDEVAAAVRGAVAG
jgi:adenylate kinase